MTRYDRAGLIVGGAQDNGPSNDTLRYVAGHNPYRADRIAGDQP